MWVRRFTNSAADRDHLPIRLVVRPKIMLLGFAIDHVEEKLAQFRVARAGPEWFHDVELQITPETRPQFSVAGEAQLVAALAEMQVRHRSDKADALPAAGNLIISGWSIRAKFRLRHNAAVMRFDRALRFEDRHKIIFVEHFGRADRH